MHARPPHSPRCLRLLSVLRRWFCCCWFIVYNYSRFCISIKYRTWRHNVKNTVFITFASGCMSRHFLENFFIYSRPLPVQTNVHFENLQFLAVAYDMIFWILQSSLWGRESWLLCLICLPGVSWWLSGSSSRCHWVVCSLWLWYFLIILTSGRQIKQSNQLSLPHQDDCNTRMDIK